MDVDLTIEGSAGLARRLVLPDSPRISVWIVDLNVPAFILGRRPEPTGWHSQFAVTTAPIDLLSAETRDMAAVTHRLAFAPLAGHFDWQRPDKPVIGVAALASVAFTAADDVMATQVTRAAAGSLTAGILPAGGRHSRMAWHAAVGVVAFALHQARAEVQG
jgi:hypothetical protein